MDWFYERNENHLLRWFEPKPGVFIAESPKVITRAIDAGYEPLEILVCKEVLHKEGDALLKQMADVPVRSVELSDFKSFSGANLTNGILCCFRRKEMPSIEQILENAKRVAVIDNIENPANVGSIFRAAAALGIEACIVTDDSADPLYKRAARVSMGDVFLIPWTYSEKDGYLSILHDCGFKTASLALKKDSVSVDSDLIKQCEKIALILGNEGDGLKAEVLDKTDYTVYIPMHNGVDSLNVSQAAAIAFYEIMK